MSSPATKQSFFGGQEIFIIGHYNKLCTPRSSTYPEKWWLEDWEGNFSGAMLNFGGVYKMHLKNSHLERIDILGGVDVVTMSPDRTWQWYDHDWSHPCKLMEICEPREITNSPSLCSAIFVCWGSESPQSWQKLAKIKALNFQIAWGGSNSLKWKILSSGCSLEIAGTSSSIQICIYIYRIIYICMVDICMVDGRNPFYQLIGKL